VRAAIQEQIRARHPSVPEPPEDLVRSRDAGDATVEAAKKELERAEIIQRIRDLPERYQEVLALFLDGYQAHEMALELGIARSLASDG
jgi:DNA-binding NarL/FixJ family response regulator